jgi:hypothetical protein
MKIRASYVTFCKYVNVEHIYTLHTKHNRSLLVNNYKHADEGQTLSV